jgi:hypothetical protein
MRTLIVGDIHGCYKEFKALLKEASVTPGKDRIISVGDMINRGPESLRVVRFFRDTPLTSAVMGNHERMFQLQQYDWLVDPSFAITLHTLKRREAEEIHDFVHSLPLFIRLEEALILHAGLDPSKPLEEQDPDVLVGNGPDSKRLISKTSWYDEIKYPVPVVFGHTISKETIRGKRANVYGLDQGCYKGGELAGLLIPDWTVLSVPSGGDYFESLKRRYLPQVWRKHIEEMDWNTLRNLDEDYFDPGLMQRADALRRRKREVIEYVQQRCSDIREEINYPYFKTSEQKELLSYLQESDFPHKQLFLRGFDEGLTEEEVERSFPTAGSLPDPRRDLSAAAEAMRERVYGYFKR